MNFAWRIASFFLVALIAAAQSKSATVQVARPEV